jgi:hypothetical protein
MKSLLAVSVVVAAACGDDLEYGCPVIYSPEGASGRALPLAEHCGGAMRFAAKYSPTLTPSQEMMDRYFERWTRANAAEPALRTGTPQRYRGNPSQILTTNPVVIDALSRLADSPVVEPGSRALPPTGDETFDAIMNELVIPEMESSSLEAATGVFRFSISTGAIFNQELLHSRLLETSSQLPEPTVNFSQDAKWTWQTLGEGAGEDNDTAVIDATIGWGDCFVSCIGLRDLRAIVPPHGPVTVYDLGGDPLPFPLSPNTIPPP